MRRRKERDDEGESLKLFTKMTNKKKKTYEKYGESDSDKN
jgi:hypothetical protein